jgi:hypothetical protein
MSAQVISRQCEDYPCCGHGPAPLGDSGGCPVRFDDGTERWPCASCGALMPQGNRSAICNGCSERVVDCYRSGCPGCRNCEGEDY